MKDFVDAMIQTLVMIELDLRAIASALKEIKKTEPHLQGSKRKSEEQP